MPIFFPLTGRRLRFLVQTCLYLFLVHFSLGFKRRLAADEELGLLWAFSIVPWSGQHTHRGTDLKQRERRALPQRTSIPDSRPSAGSALCHANSWLLSRGQGKRTRGHPATGGSTVRVDLRRCPTHSILGRSWASWQLRLAG